ncbi:VCBS domain-containing protein, partial [Vibrio sp. F74]|uniref:VCBS domain-containing protein n=1 Tax=Vibrio sp. F74 TaxID=700020 RepID=UPI0035F56D0E
MNALIGAIAGSKFFIVIDKNGNLKTITDIQDVKPGEVLLTKGEDPITSDTAIQAELVEEDGNRVPIAVQDEIDQIFEQLADGQDPTLLDEEFAPAAGLSEGSSATPMAVVVRDALEVMASTSFDTTGIESQGLSRTQSLQLLQQFINQAPTVTLSNFVDSLDENTPTDGTIRVADIDITDDQQGINELSLSGADANNFIIVELADGSYELHLKAGVTLDFESLSSMDVSVDVKDLTLSQNVLDTDSMTLNVNDLGEDPVISGKFDGGVKEDVYEDSQEVIQVTGTIIVADEDASESGFITQGVQEGVYGSFEFNSGTGIWKYTLNNESDIVQSLPEGDKKTETFIVQTLDGTERTITVVVTGTNDLPEVQGEFSGSVVEGDLEDISTVPGLISIGDVDSDNNPIFEATTIEGLYGELVLRGDGEWTYSLDQESVQSLKGPQGEQGSEGYLSAETLTDIITLTATDGTTQDITITIIGTNDGPVAVADTGQTDEDTTLVVDAVNGVLKNDTDVEQDSLTVSSVNGDNSKVGQTITLESGAALILNEDGSYSYDPNGAFESLGVDDKATDSFTYTANDGTEDSEPVTVTITINGTNDGPVAVADTGQTDEDTTLVVDAVNGVLKNDTDVEQDSLTVSSVNGDSSKVGQTITLESGAALILNEDGSYSYDPNGAFESLGVDDKATDSFTYTANDGTEDSEPVTVTITINGTNDGPVAVADTGQTDEDTTLVVDAVNGVLKNDTDVEQDSLTVSSVNGDSSKVGQTITLESGAALILNENGSYSYDPNGAFESLGVDDKATDSFTYTANDGTEDSEPVTVT